MCAVGADCNGGNGRRVDFDGGDLLAGHRVPEPDFIVARPGNDPRAVRTDRNAGDGFALDLKGFEQPSGGGVPEFGESVACTGDDLRAVGAECEAKNGPVVPETLRDE